MNTKVDRCKDQEVRDVIFTYCLGGLRRTPGLAIRVMIRASSLVNITKYFLFILS